MWILIPVLSSIFHLFLVILFNPNIVFPPLISILKYKAFQIQVLYPPSLESELLVGSRLIPLPMLFPHGQVSFSFPLSQWIQNSSGYEDLKVLNLRKTLKIDLPFPGNSSENLKRRLLVQNSSFRQTQWVLLNYSENSNCRNLPLEENSRI